MQNISACNELKKITISLQDKTQRDMSSKGASAADFDLVDNILISICMQEQSYQNPNTLLKSL